MDSEDSEENELAAALEARVWRVSPGGGRRDLSGGQWSVVDEPRRIKFWMKFPNPEKTVRISEDERRLAVQDV
jgi:hypothetical protein